MFAQCTRAVRGFVRWKLRLDRIFELLAAELAAAENLGSETVVDLGCGYGMALCFAAFGDDRRRLVGCDLDEHRIAVARKALSALNADVTVADIRYFELPPAGLILIMDVLQCLPAAEQSALLKRCCSALTPNGMLIFRVHDRERGVFVGDHAWPSSDCSSRATTSAYSLKFCRSPTTAAYSRTQVCSWKSAISRIACLWLTSYSSQENLGPKLHYDGPRSLPSAFT